MKLETPELFPRLLIVAGRSMLDTIGIATPRPKFPARLSMLESDEGAKRCSVRPKPTAVAFPMPDARAKAAGAREKLLLSKEGVICLDRPFPSC